MNGLSDEDQAWTKEPWVRDSDERGFVGLNFYDWLRARDCVNALAGIDPKKLVESHAELYALVRTFAPTIENKAGSLDSIIARAEALRP